MTRIRIVDIGAGDGRLADVLLECFPRATLLALDGSESMRAAITARTAGVADRIQVRAFELDTLDWWDLMHASDLVVSSLCLHHLNDAKKQYLYKAIAERLTARGALLIADLVEPAHAAARRVAADSWDASARAQADAAGGAGTVCHLRREPVEPLPVSRSQGSPVGALPPFRLAETRRLRTSSIAAGSTRDMPSTAGSRPVVAAAGSGIAFERALTTVRARLSRRMPSDC